MTKTQIVQNVRSFLQSRDGPASADARQEYYIACAALFDTPESERIANSNAVVAFDQQVAGALNDTTSSSAVDAALAALEGDEAFVCSFVVETLAKLLAESQWVDRDANQTVEVVALLTPKLKPNPTALCAITQRVHLAVRSDPLKLAKAWQHIAPLWTALGCKDLVKTISQILNGATQFSIEPQYDLGLTLLTSFERTSEFRQKAMAQLAIACTNWMDARMALQSHLIPIGIPWWLQPSRELLSASGAKDSEISNFAVPVARHLRALLQTELVHQLQTGQVGASKAAQNLALALAEPNFRDEQQYSGMLNGLNRVVDTLTTNAWIAAYGEVAHTMGRLLPKDDPRVTRMELMRKYAILHGAENTSRMRRHAQLHADLLLTMLQARSDTYEGRARIKREIAGLFHEDTLEAGKTPAPGEVHKNAEICRDVMTIL